MEIKTKSGKILNVQIKQNYTISFDRLLVDLAQLGIGLQGIANASLTEKADGKDGYFLSAGRHTVSGKTRLIYIAIEKTDYDNFQIEITKIKDNIISKLQSGELQVTETVIEGDPWEGIPNRKIKHIKGVDDDSVDFILSEVPETKAKKEAKEITRNNKNKEAMKKAIANGYCPNCGTYCFGDCGLEEPEANEVIELDHPQDY